MVQAVENWTCVTGKILSVSAEPADGRLVLQLQLERSKPVDGFPDLLQAKSGDVISIALPPVLTDVKALKAGETATLKVRLARGPKLFAHPDWKPGQQLPLC